MSRAENADVSPSVAALLHCWARRIKEVERLMQENNDLRAKLAAVESLRVSADRVGLRYVSVTMLSDALRSESGTP